MPPHFKALGRRVDLFPADPLSRISRTSSRSSPQGVLRSNSSALARPSRIVVRRCPRGTPQGSTTPSRIETLLSPTTSSAFGSLRVPSPPQPVHAPYGELNENCLGSSSGRLMPQEG